MKIKKVISPFLVGFLLCFGAASAFAIESGKVAPALTLKTLKNHQQQQIKLEDYKGKVVYLDFWASWCGPCRDSFPVLDELRAKYVEAGFEVVGVNLDENTSDADGFLKKFPVKFPLAADPSGRSAEIYQLKGMPSAYVIDKKGVVRHIVVGFDKDEKKNLEPLIAQLVNE
ncbi:Peroxiredoxin [Alteromonadaceae bacterium Bs31]|nr:Peroxiredoxin [Alteromonadaceae bacterium Bs31]